MNKYTPEQVLADARSVRGIGYPLIAGELEAFATLLREREAAKEAVTEEMVELALTAMCGEQFADLSGEADAAYRASMRAALEAVAPMLASAQQPIPMILHCPSCGVQHIDAPDGTVSVHMDGQETVWNNPPHRSHLCHNCGTIWRPADVPTVGVEKIHTEGKNDVVVPPPTMASARVPGYYCKECGTHEVSVALTCHNSGCSKYASEHEIYRGWEDPLLAAAPKPEKEE